MLYAPLIFKNMASGSRTLLLIAILCLNSCTPTYSQGFPGFQFLTETCGEIPNETLGTGQFSAGIFTNKKNNTKALNLTISELRFHHTGAIIHSNVVLTVLKSNATHFLDENGDSITKLFIAGGNNIADPSDPQTQFREVDAIIPYLNSSAPQGYVLVLLYFLKPLDLQSPWVQSICLPLKSIFPSLTKGPVHQSSFFSVRGFAEKNLGSSGPRRFVQLMVNGSSAECQKRFDNIYDEGNLEGLYCGWEHTQATNGACASRGSIDNVRHEGRVYLFGIAVLVPGQSCSKNSTVFFYDLFDSGEELQDWLISSMKCLSLNKLSCPSGECLDWDNMCNSKPSCNDGSDYDEIPGLCNYYSNPCKTNSFFCGVGYGCVTNGQECDGSSNCDNGADEDPTLCDRKGKGLKESDAGITIKPQPSFVETLSRAAKSFCPIFQYSSGVARRCSSNGRNIDCDKAVVGTVLELHCKPFYLPETRFPRHEMTCTQDGSWFPFKPFLCKADCGRIDSKAQPYISNGMSVSEDFTFPWYAAIFTWRNRTRKFEYSCGASLIENSVIATAAHCVIKNGGTNINPKRFRVVLAPTSSTFVDNEGLIGTKILEVDRIWVPGTYDPVTLTSDMALVRLNESIEYTRNIQPVCYLIDNSPQVGSVGLIAGFGKDESNRVSKNLKYAAFPVISNRDCSISLGIYIEGNEFCAGYQNGTSACEGDSGSGLVFSEFSSTTSEIQSYTLKGIVSRGLGSATNDCVTNAVNVFTHFDAFGAWILETLSRYDVF